jgi:hypothetical protein
MTTRKKQQRTPAVRKTLEQRQADLTAKLDKIKTQVQIRTLQASLKK